MRSRAKVKSAMVILACAMVLGIAASSLHAETLVAKEATWAYRKGNSEATPLDRSGWRTNGFNDSGWSSAQAPIGYGNPPETAWINTTLSDMQGGYSSVYLRKTFTVADPSDITALKLIICWDDGFIAWINGERVADRDEPETAAHYALASNNHESWEVDDENPPSVTNAMYENIWLGLEPNEIEELLVVGDNVLAIQVFNSTLGSSDMCIDAKLRTAVADTKFSHDRGFYDSSFSVTISTKTPGATIRYTTDGTWPTSTHGSTGGTNAVVSITKTTVLRAAAYHADHHATDEDTQTYIFLANAITQPSTPSGFPATWPLLLDTADSQYADYQMDPNVVNDSRYTSSMTSYLKSIPSLSIVAPVSDIFSSDGFYCNGGGLGGANEVFEKRVSAELIHPDGRKGFQINCGIRPRSWRHKKRGLTLLFKGEYGPSKLRYPVFQDAPVDAESAVSRFDRLILRGGANDSWQAGSMAGYSASIATYINDAFANETELAQTGVAIHNDFVHLYLNGLYWGLYHIVERPDAWFTSSYFGGEKDSWYAGNHGDNSHGAISGDGSRWWSMLSQANKDLSGASNYNQMKSLLDVTSYIDNCLLRFYIGMGDWVASRASGNYEYVNNYYVGNPNGGAVKYFSWDSETAWRVLDDPTGYGSRANDGAWIKPQFHERYNPLKHYYVARPMRAMGKNSDFRTLFSDRLYKHCFNDGALSDAASKLRWDALAARIEDAIVCESARWGDLMRDYKGTTYSLYTRHDHWYDARDRIRGLMTGNGTQLRDAARTTYVNGERLYPSQDPPGFNQHGGEVVSGFQITITNPNTSGSIYYTTNGVDPRASGGGSYAGATKGLEPLYETITKTTHLKARVRTGTWSALHEATFHVVYSATGLRLTEIMYKPRDQESPYVAGGEFEFLEFKNTGGSTVGLSDFTLGGVEYTFPVDTLVAAGDFLLVVKNLAKFQSRYPGVTCETLQWTSGGLDNGGEKIRLRNPEGNTILSCEYDEDPPWPLGPDADGMGRSLANTNPGGDPDNPENWRASSAVDGSPGDDDPAPGYGLGVIVNEVMAHTDDTKGDKIELYNSGGSSVNITGWYLSDAYDPGNEGADYKLKKWQIPTVTIPAGGYHVFYETNHTPAFGSAFQLHEWGDQVYLASASGGNLSGYIVGGDFGASENGVALGRYETSEGEEDFFPALVSWTGSNANNDPKVGPVVINEIMYNPPETGSSTNEYIELLNLTGSSIDISDWDLEGAGYLFPGSTVIQANDYLVLLDTNSSVSPSSFRSQHGIPGSVPILGANFALGNNGEALRLEMPNSDSDTNATDILVDRVRYNDKSPWPSQAAGGGPSLERVVASDYGNEPLNWRADNDGGTPGAANTFVAGVAIHKNSNWRYHDKGYSLGTSWRDAAYSDSGWDDGDGVLGYGGSGKTTILSYGPDSDDKYPTCYFRKTFTMQDDPSRITELKLHALYDDGFVAYINGQEVTRGSMSSSDPMPYTEYAQLINGSQGLYEENTITAYASNLVQGANVLAVEVHQVSLGSSDITWDCRLTYAVSGMPTVDVDISPHGAPFTDPINVTITANPTDATIYYTTDGSSPGVGDPTIVSGNSIQLTGGCTVRARGEKVDYNAGTDSAVFSYVPRTASFGAASSSAVEEAGTVNLAVVLSTTSGSQITVDYSVDAGSSTAAEGSDFSLSAGTLTFAPGVSSRNIALQILEDTREEESETVVVQLDSASGADVGSPSSHTHTIQDDDGPDLAWVAYNDMMWAATDPTTNITLISGWVNGWMTNSGELVDYASGTGVGVTLSISDPGTYLEAYRTDQGGNASSGTDAYTNFNGIVGCFGNMPGGNTYTLTFSGVDPDDVYTLVVFGNRNEAGYTDRTTEYVLGGGLDSFVNDSTPGTDILTNSTPNDTTRHCSGYNTVAGYVARWTGIRTTGTTLTLTVQGGTHRYINAMKLECRSSSGASETVKIAKGSTWKYRKGNAEASDPPTDWRRRVFDDSGWSSGTAPIGYGDKAATSLADMQFGYSCVFYRQTFSIGSPDIVERLKLDVDYDDAFIAWVNGEEVARVNMAGNTGDFMAYTNFAAGNQAATWSKDYLGAEIPQLVAGANVLAAQLFNRSLDSSDADLDIQLSVVEGSFLYVDDDADDDDMDDAWEVDTCPGGDGDPAVDYEPDGLSTLQEYVAGTDPNDAASCFALTVDASGPDAIISFDTIDTAGVTGYGGMIRRYTLERRLDLFSGGLWVDVPGYVNLPGNGATVSYTNPPGQNVEYYRARVWLE